MGVPANSSIAQKVRQRISRLYDLWIGQVYSVQRLCGKKLKAPSPGAFSTAQGSCRTAEMGAGCVYKGAARISSKPRPRGGFCGAKPWRRPRDGCPKRVQRRCENRLEAASPPETDRAVPVRVPTALSASASSTQLPIQHRPFLRSERSAQSTQTHVGLSLQSRFCVI
jgi:hypothetical protein